jgi:predicted transcriptional regulator
MQRDQVTLLSVRPRFADALLDGTKTVEIRRRRARIADGSLCLLYASSPVCALVGAIRVRRTDADTPDALWSRWGEQAGLSRLEYDSYLCGSTLPCAIVVAAAVALHYPISLDELRRRQDDFVTPQSYRFLRARELAALTNGQARQLDQIVVAGSSATVTPIARHARTPAHGTAPPAETLFEPLPGDLSRVGHG